MSFVVAVATATTSWITQSFVERSYERLLVKDFKAKVGAFSGRQLERLERVRKNCRAMAENHVLVDAMQGGDKNKIKGAIKALTGAVQALDRDTPTVAGPAGFLTMENGMRGSTGRAGFIGRETAPDLPGGSRKRGSEAPPVKPNNNKNTLGYPIGVLDASGELLNSGDARLPLGTIGLRNGKRPEEIRAMLKRLAERAGKEQEITYRADINGHLLEMIITPILTQDTRHPLGALIVGVPMSDLGEHDMHLYSQLKSDDNKGDDSEGISSGLWLEGKLYTETIPIKDRDQIAEAVEHRIEKVKNGDIFHEVRVLLQEEGQEVPHKVIFRVLNPDSPFPPAAQVCLYSMATELAEIEDVQHRTLGIGALILAIAHVLIMLLTFRLTLPIRALVAGTEAVRGGNFDVFVPVTTHDEIGRLAASFNEMTEGLKMNQKYQRVLSQVADPEVANQLMNNENALGGEMRDVTMLFCDIRGFTQLTADMAPDEVIDLLNEHMTAMTAIVHELGGVVDKFVGDMVMALFGAPVTHGFDSLRATRCAVRMVEERTRLNGQGKWRFQVGIGIATGRVIAGCMGSEERLDYTVLGERVNLAARLCSHAGEGQIMIDDETLAILEESVVAEVLPGLALKGYPATITAYKVIGLNPAALAQPL